jgi:hypothetical protein
MKKIFTLIIAALAVSATYAQTSSQEESRRVILGKQKKSGSEETGTKKEGRTMRDIIFGDENKTSRNDGGTYSTERQAEIDRINRDYDSKIASIRNNSSLSNEEKERIIRGLENERARKIREVNKKYNDRDDRDDDGDDDNDKVKENKGKHLGWEKGVGNPHRTGSDKQMGKDKDHSKGKGKSKGKSKKG